MVPEGKYQKPPTQTHAPIEARPGEMVPSNLDRGRCFPSLAGSSGDRKLIVTISGRFRSSRRLSKEPGERPPTVPVLVNGALTRNRSLWDENVTLLNIGVGTSCLVSFERESLV